MTKPSRLAMDILRAALKVNGGKRAWGTRNSWFGHSEPTPLVRELIQAGYFVPAASLSAETRQYKATAAGMRAAGLSPSQIERAIKL